MNRKIAEVDFDIRRLICAITGGRLRCLTADLQDHTGRTSISDGRSARLLAEDFDITRLICEITREDIDTTSFVILKPA
ncbi:MAG TPA: hypothetical protein VN380_09530 [Thermoanaerobaculia bacterium]|nr:hypothetical protein [Thermoanaerobaculia bacterium]